MQSARQFPSEYDPHIIQWGHGQTLWSLGDKHSSGNGKCAHGKGHGPPQPKKYDAITNVEFRDRSEARPLINLASMKTIVSGGEHVHLQVFVNV